MKISRREFLAASGLALGFWFPGCGRQPALRPRRLEHWNVGTGATEAALDLQLFGAKWEAINTSDHGFLLSNGSSILALNFSGQSQIYEGAQEACWVDPSLLVTAAKVNSDLYRVGARDFANGRPRWTQDLGYGGLLGCNTQSVFVAHTQGVSCFDLQLGKETWRNPALTEIKSYYLGSKSLILGRGNSGQFCWVDLQTGMARNQSTTRTPNRVILVVSDDRTTLALTRRIGVAGFRPDQDGPVWTLPLKESVHRTTLLGVAHGVAVIELDNSSVALDLTTGRRLWSDVFCARLSICCEVALIRRAAGLGSGQATLELQARELHTGRLTWKRQITDSKAITAVDGDRFAVLTS